MPAQRRPFSRDSLSREAGAFKRGASNFQNWIAPASAFPPEPDRYHLYINYTCGWCHRVLVVHALKRIPASVVSVSATANYFWGGGLGSDDYSGWAFDAENPDPVLNAKHTRDIYLTDSPDYGRRQLSVPILFDKKTRKIVSNDNIQIGYILNSCLDDLLDEDRGGATNPHPLHFKAVLRKDYRYYDTTLAQNIPPSTPKPSECRKKLRSPSPFSAFLNEGGVGLPVTLPEKEGKSLDLYPKELRAQIDATRSQSPPLSPL